MIDTPAEQRRSSRAIGFLKVSAIADLLDVSVRSVWRWIKAGELKVHRAGKVVRVSKTDFLLFVEERREGRDHE